MTLDENQSFCFKLIVHLVQQSGRKQMLVFCLIVCKGSTSPPSSIQAQTKLRRKHKIHILQKGKLAYLTSFCYVSQILTPILLQRNATKHAHTTASRPTKVNGWKFTHHGWISNHWLETQPLVGKPTRCGWNSDHLLNQYPLIEVLCRKHYSSLNISSGRFLVGPSP